MPRKMAGIAMITMVASMVAMRALIVVLESAIQGYRLDLLLSDVPFMCPKSTRRWVSGQCTPRHLLNGNYLLWMGSEGRGLVAWPVRPGTRRSGRVLEDVVHRCEPEQDE